MPKGPPPELVVCARAKVNLYLHVTGRRADGYHELDSLMVFPQVGDRLILSAHSGLTLEVSGPFAEPLAEEASENLVLRAARALRNYGGRSGAPGANLRLEKNLPVAAGLGGGSADAAAALNGLIRLWGLDINPDDLRTMAVKLGADVPPCLESRPVFAAGIGEVLTPANGLPPFWLLLVNPRLPVATAQVFRARKGTFSTADPWNDSPKGFEDLLLRLESRRNDLEPAAREIEPEIGRVLDALADMPGCRLTRMSGSGATCFGMFGDEDAASAAAANLAGARPDWWVASAPVPA